ncbi:glyoxylate/hydroxypyruvate reductase A isoform X3 [Cherax quadricarinatus]|uniref:glyoxylate/hydroxypyruvate reductase A isoform X3 n=1 Tax=Cherax quadricarinatus TaxID=27406 RepID=UPI00387E6C8B
MMFQVLQDAEVLLIDNDLLPQAVERLPLLRWAQGTWAGVDNVINFFKNKLKPRIPISRMVSKSFSQLMAEYVLGSIICHERSWMTSRQNQLKSEWNKAAVMKYRSLQDLTVGVLGMGIIGREVAKYLRTFNSTVHAYTRTAPPVESKSIHVDKYWRSDELPLFLQQCDYIVNILPSTSETRGMLGSDILKNAKKNAVLINVGRGDVISEADIVKALDSGWISAAILDVVEKEPLSPESLLWTHPKCILTPHTAAVVVFRPEDIADAFSRNYQDFLQGNSISGTIDFSRGY